MDENGISRIVIDSAIEVHRALGGSGLLEPIYEHALAWEIQRKKLVVERRANCRFMIKGFSFLFRYAWIPLSKVWSLWNVRRH